MDSGHEVPVPIVRMSLGEARQVHWLRNRPKPLGELMDEGYLDPYRLEWAAKNAYDPRLKQAARVLIEWRSSLGAGKPEEQARPTDAVASSRQPAHVGMTLDEVRSTAWPFAQLRGQTMGSLSDTRQLSLKDLAYAVENAWDDRVRRAAIALLLVRLDQELAEPPPQAGSPRVVCPSRSYAERKQLSLALLEGVIAGAGLALSAAYVISLLSRKRVSPGEASILSSALSSPEGVTGLILAVIFVGVLVALAVLVPQLVFKRFDRQIESYRRGQKGEERVVEKVLRALDGNWVLFRNIRLPGRSRADLDIVLVGPPGVWAIEVKSFGGSYRNLGEDWEYRIGGGWIRMRKSPSRQAVKGAASLSGFLRADGIKVFVSPAIAWANDEIHPAVDNPIVPVWTMDRLEDEAGNLWNGRRLDQATKDRITEKLTKLCRISRGGSW